MRTRCDEAPAEPLIGRAGPERRCILTGRSGGRAGLVRLVLGPDAAVWPDVGGRLPGRGAWITPDRALIAQAVASGQLARALARSWRLSPPAIAPDLAERIGEMLQRRSLERLGLELRTGHLIFGAEKIAQSARSGRCFLLLHAADAATDGAARLDQAMRAGGRDAAACRRLPVGREKLSASLGRENVVHSGVTDGKAAARIAADVARWLAFAHDSTMVLGDGAAPRPQHEEGRE
jgi:predicted RNA-binding protein YlxR (DUF448 family)